MRIKKGDTVLVISGKDKNRKGKIIQALPKKGKVVVEGINLKKKHVKPKKNGEKGQMVQIAAPFDISNVQLICTKCSKATRVGYKMEGETKFRYCKKCGKEI
jgi:large subunit ribosomal protein L24